MKTLSVALTLSRMGFSIIPIYPKDKKPLIPWAEFQSRKASDGEIKGWYSRYQNLNIGIVTGAISGVIVLDIDGETGHKSLEGRELPKTWTAKTGREGGGFHYYFKHPGGKIKNFARKLPGLDLRGDGGYVVAPPSVHASGNPYEWGVSPDEAPLAEAPQWLLDLVMEKREPAKAGGSVTALDPSKMGEGSGRNTYLTSLGGKLRHAGLRQSEIEKSLLIENRKFGVSLPDDEVKKVAESLAKYPAGSGKTSTKSIEEVLSESEIRSLNNDSSIDDKGSALRKFIELAKELDEVDRRLAVNEATKIFRAAKMSGFGDLLKKELLRNNPEEYEGQGQSVLFEDIEPWHKEVDGAELVEDISAIIGRFVVMTEIAIIANALWIVHAWTIGASRISPLLRIESPVKGCGKSTLLMVNGELMPRNIMTANMNISHLYRLVDSHDISLCIDETDTSFRENQDLIGLINAGYLKKTSLVPRCVGDSHEVKLFSSWCPKVLAGIGRLPDTTESRCIHIRLERKLLGETTEPFSLCRTEIFAEVRAKLKRWSDDNMEDLMDADPPVPKGLGDRPSDNWRPLLAIADHVGGEYPQKARDAALFLSGEAKQEDDSLVVKLLSDIQIFFKEKEVEQIDTTALLAYLCLLEDRPWNVFNKGAFPMKPQQLAKQLVVFGIKSIQFKMASGEKKRGYRRAQFNDAFDRYLPGTYGTTLKEKDLFDFSGGTDNGKVPGKNIHNSFNNNAVPEVPDGMTGFDEKK